MVGSRRLCSGTRLCAAEVPHRLGVVMTRDFPSEVDVILERQEFWRMFRFRIILATIFAVVAVPTIAVVLYLVSAGSL